MCKAIPPLHTVCHHGVLRNNILFCVTYILHYNLPHNYNFSPLSFHTLDLIIWSLGCIQFLPETAITLAPYSLCVYTLLLYIKINMPSPINLNESKTDCSARIPHRLLSVNLLQLWLGGTGFTKYVTLPLNVCPSGFKFFLGCQMHLNLLTILHQHQMSCLLWSCSENKILVLLYTFV
jgi:hypothetical protein